MEMKEEMVFIVVFENGDMFTKPINSHYAAQELLYHDRDKGWGIAQYCYKQEQTFYIKSLTKKMIEKHKIEIKRRQRIIKNLELLMKENSYESI